MADIDVPTCHSTKTALFDEEHVACNGAAISYYRSGPRSRLTVPDPHGHVGGRTVTVFYQYGHVGGLTVGRLDSSRSRSISGPGRYPVPVDIRSRSISGPN